ncbi:hypothetical protein C8R47DRAFT_738982 [Mycena vitilis]|nr:hypothetical protein C8R47DRAFT_738982 [Mycena vitilis]
MSANTSTALVHLAGTAPADGMQLIRGSASDPAEGRTLHQVYLRIGDFVGTRVNRAAHRRGRGPSAIADRIEAHFGVGQQREDSLEALLAGGLDYLWLEEECAKLMKYALPYETARTQVETFKCLVTIATRYHKGESTVKFRTPGWRGGVPSESLKNFLTLISK